jgi:heme/copper-type cytochrome/quinol oxidase subunit 1
MVGMTAPQPSSSRPARTVRVVLVALVVLGLVLLGAAVWAESRTASYGWFAYAPLSDTTYAPSGPSSGGTVALLSGAGALLLGGAAGFVVGRRGRPVPDTPDDGGGR